MQVEDYSPLEVVISLSGSMCSLRASRNARQAGRVRQVYIKQGLMRSYRLPGCQHIVPAETLPGHIRVAMPLRKGSSISLAPGHTVPEKSVRNVLAQCRGDLYPTGLSEASSMRLSFPMCV